MSSDWAPSRLGRICTVLILVSVAIHPACGRKEDPEPPPRKNPAATRDLKIAQRGMELILTFSYPTMTMGGIGLVGGVDRIEIDGFVRAAPEFMEQPTVEGEELEGELATDDEPDTVGIASEVEGSGEPGTEETPETSPEAPQPEASAEPMVRERPEQEPEVTDRPEMTQEERQRAREARAGEAQERAQAAERDEIEREEQGVEEEAKAEAAIGEAEAVDQTEEMEELAEGEDSADPFDAPEPNPFLQIRMDADEFRKEANRIMVLEEEALTSAIIGGQVVVRLPLSEVPTEPPVAHGYQLRTYSRRLESPDSNLAAFVPLPPPDSPQDLTLTPSAGGVTVAWAPLEDEEEIEGYNVYRRLAQSRYYDRAISMTEPGQSEFLDRSPQYGNSYIYSVTAVRMRNPLVESATGREREITFRDDFPPPPPRELVVLAEVGRVRLVWQASQAKDVVSYLVFARQGDGEPKLLTPDPLATAEFRHEGVISGTTYTYFVVAVDSKGNRSEPSEETSTRAP
jgi:hypothetical protein